MIDNKYDLKQQRLNRMSKNEAREEILDQYIKPSKISLSSLKKVRTRETQKMSLKDFYLEVQQKNSIGPDSYYHGKSAHDIEIMMMKNRQLIENKKKHN